MMPSLSSRIQKMSLPERPSLVVNRLNDLPSYLEAPPVIDPIQIAPDLSTMSEKMRRSAIPASLPKLVNALPSYRIGPPKLANQMLPSRSSRMLRKITRGISGVDLSAIGVKYGSGARP